MQSLLSLLMAVTAIFLDVFLVYAQQPALKLNEQEYFDLPGTNVMVFQDIYPEGHQGGISLIQNGVRVASNGDLRLSSTPGQWAPVPKMDKRTVNREGNEIAVQLSYPDPARNRKGFNPIDYPDLNFSYQVHVKGEGQGIRIVVDLDRPLPAEWIGKVGFNLELYPTVLFGKAWYLGGKTGIFPRQANGPAWRDSSGEAQAAAMASGPRLTVAPEVESQRLIIESKTGDLQLLDGRVQHNNGWFVVRSLVPSGAASGAIEWVVIPHVIPGWHYNPVVHVSQVGYHPKQKKMAILEMDVQDERLEPVSVKRVGEDGALEEALSGKPTLWGKYLRYKYLQFDFSQLTRSGMYLIDFGGFRTHPFQISEDVFKRHVWQPTLEYFLPIQMCHMRVEELYRVWHGACHLDDARMAPLNHNHFDGYLQGPSTLTTFKPGETVPGLNVGGWHDAGDDDLRVESQADEVFILANAYETFGIEYDDTTVDQRRQLVQIHQPDGKPDLLQQVEHGVLTLLGSYKSMGRFYRGIITPTLSQYVMMDDTVNVTDNQFYNADLKQDQKTATQSGKADDRWVFTEENSMHEFKGIYALAIAGRVLRKFDPALAKTCVEAAEALWKQDRDVKRGFNDRMVAAVELWITTEKPEYEQVLIDNRKDIITRIDSTGWIVGQVLSKIEDKGFVEEIRTAVAQSFAKTVQRQKENPFGVPYRPRIWGAGWEIQRFGVEQYYLHRAFPDIVSTDYMFNALNFVLGVHPGDNTASFASGVGARSTLVTYGYNRANWTYIPGGVVSGTALIRPDFPELKDFPFLWQQTEYVLGGGASNYMFLVLAADQVLQK
jgi:endoglucanase